MAVDQPGGGPDDWMNDPNMDPELAMALRISLEESRARQQQENNTQQTPNVPETVPEVPESNTENMQSGDVTNATTAGDGINDTEETGSVGEDELLMHALQMSLATEGMVDQAENDDDGEDAEEEKMDLENVDFSQLTEEEQIQFALQMSMKDAEKENDNKDGDMAE